MRTRRALLALALAALAAGCSLAVSVDGLSGGAPAGADASRPGSDAAADVAATDDDAKGPSANDGAAADGAALGFCASSPGHTICTDFDPPSDYTTTWSPIVESGTLVITNDGRSAPSALTATAEGSTAKDTSARIYADAKRVPGHVRVQVDLGLSPSPPNAGEIELVKIEVGTLEGAIGYSASACSLVRYPSGLSFGCFGRTEANTLYTNQAPIGSNAPAGAWSRFVIDVDLSIAGKVVVVRDGAMVVDETWRTIPANAQTVRVVLGTYSEGVSDKTTTRVDDVLVDFQ